MAGSKGQRRGLGGPRPAPCPVRPRVPASVLTHSTGDGRQRWPPCLGPSLPAAGLSSRRDTPRTPGSATPCPTDCEHPLCQPALSHCPHPSLPAPVVMGAGASPLPPAAHSSRPLSASQCPPPGVAAPSQSAQQLSLTLGPRNRLPPPRPPSPALSAASGAGLATMCGSSAAPRAPGTSQTRRAGCGVHCDWFCCRVSRSLPSGII